MEKKKVKTRFMTLALLAEEVKKDYGAIELLEELRWPNGKPICIRCGCESDRHYVMGVSKTRDMFKCRQCGFKFKATSGTFLERSRVPLPTLFVGLYILYHYRDKVPEKALINDLKLTPTSVLCGHWREKILAVLPDPNKPGRVHRSGEEGVIKKYESGHINFEHLFDYLFTLKPGVKSNREVLDIRSIVAEERSSVGDSIMINLRRE